MTNEQLINDFAIRSFRDQGDQDYISARMSFRAALVTPALWSAHQMVEKYIKCILLLNRIPAKQMWHDLSAGLEAIEAASKISLNLTPHTESFIEYLNAFGRYRYLEISNAASGRSLPWLDRTAWELRRFCSLDKTHHALSLRQGHLAPRFRISKGYLEKIMDDCQTRTREALLWNNAFFGQRRRRFVRVSPWFIATNAPLYLSPQILDQVLKYVHLPAGITSSDRSLLRMRQSQSHSGR